MNTYKCDIKYNIRTSLKTIISIFILEFVYLFYLCNTLHLNKICLCSFLDIHLYSNNLSTIAIFSSLFILDLLPACLSCNNIFHL